MTSQVGSDVNHRHGYCSYGDDGVPLIMSNKVWRPHDTEPGVEVLESVEWIPCPECRPDARE